ncbi:MAG: acyl-CoA dehydrogenase, partial [Bdellovibrionales bacterium]|nr:acyl-CoA dehydrogenase [Bdellovibrionales bacterium]
YLTKPILRLATKAVPSLSDTEQQALEAGDIWFDAMLFSGSPDWQKLLDTPPPKLSEREQNFLDGPVEELCQMVDEWEINRELKDLPPEVWKFIRNKGFFGMIIPEKYGGLDFSAYANSQVVHKIASRSVVAAVTVMVPNSLGPGELLVLFGTEAQQEYWLPRLASGEEIPCFGLTSPEAGSDAASMEDHGVVCIKKIKGKEVTGIRLNWHKRYITLGPVATVQGLAFTLSDPEHILGEEEDLGITVALVPTDLEGIEIGRRHLPSGQMFQNGPNWGRDVFIPLDYVIGGKKQIGNGWKMLMTALGAGRGISLPSLSAAGTAYAARTTGAYSRIREQFGIPIGKFEGIQVRLGRLGANAYLLEAARRLTCAGLDKGKNLSVISAIMKTHATYRMRDSIIDAMDVHAGKTVVEGPSNYLSHFYRSLPVGITVEGANILTRNLIIFGQGAIRCHPWILKEMLALKERDDSKALREFDKAFWGHAYHATCVTFQAWIRSWSGALIASAPPVSKKVKSYYKKLSRYAACFALLSEVALLTLGGGLKKKEMISGRLGDILSELYLLSAVLKRWHDDGEKKEDLPLVRYCLFDGFTRIEERIAAILRNLPNRPAAWLAQLICQPLGASHYGPSDETVRQCAEILLKPSELRERLTAGLHLGEPGDAVYDLERAFHLVTETENLKEKLKSAGLNDRDEALQKGVLTKKEAETLEETEQLVLKVIAVDHFSPKEMNSELKEAA